MILRKSRWLRKSFIIRLLFLSVIVFSSVLPETGAADPGRTGMIRSISDRGVIRIGLQEDYQPFHIKNPRKGYPGIDIEIGEIIAGQMGVKAEFVFLPLPELLKAVNAGLIDLSLGGVSSNMERARMVNFSDPYMTMSPAGLLARRVLPPESGSVDTYPANRFESLADLVNLNNLKIGVKSGTTNSALLTSDAAFKRHSIIQFETRKEAYDSLASYQIDVLVGDDVYLRSQLMRYPHLKTSYVPLFKPYREEHVSAMLPPGDAEYWNYINFIVKEIKRTGMIQEITSRYLNSSQWLPEAE